MSHPDVKVAPSIVDQYSKRSSNSRISTYEQSLNVNDVQRRMNVDYTVQIDDLQQGFPTEIKRGPHTCQSGHKVGHMEQKLLGVYRFSEEF